MKRLILILLLLKCGFTYAQIGFWPYVSSSVNARAKSVTTGDFNHDGLTDVVVGGEYSSLPEYANQIFVFTQNDEGLMNGPAKYRYKDGYSFEVVVQSGDVNNDGLNDVITGFSPGLGIFYQNNEGTLDSIYMLQDSISVDGLATGDLNQDGLTDIVACHPYCDTISVYYQSAAGDFIVENIILPTGGYSEINIADMNSDGLDDIIYMPGSYSNGAENGSLSIFYQDDGNGIIPEPDVYFYQWDIYKRFNGIGIGDLNSDGRTDIAASIGGNYSAMGVILQNEQGGLGEADFIDAYDIPTPVEISDLNCDGKNEIVVGHDGWSHFSVYEQDSLGNYSDYRLFRYLNYIDQYGLAVDDINSDARPDVIAASGYGGYFIYSNAAPDTLSAVDSLFIYDVFVIDTVVSYVITDEITVIDTVNECILESLFEHSVKNDLVSHRYEGDSARVRYYDICGGSFQDTIHNYFDEYFTEHLYDTTIQLISVDTLYASYEWYTEYIYLDTLSQYTQNYADTLVLEDITIVNDSVYIATDSLFINYLQWWIELNKKHYDVYEGLLCGNIVYDTVFTYDTYIVDMELLESDTILISHTETVYSLGIEPVNKKPLFIIYPNPARDQLNLRCDFPARLELYSLHGKLLMETADKKLDLSRLPESVYIAIVRDDKGHPLGTQKILKR